MKSINDLDLSKISESHLMLLGVGHKMFYRGENPLLFGYNDTTFTTKVPVKERIQVSGANSGYFYTGTTEEVVNTETKNREGKIYEIVVIIPIDRILDLDKVCQEQGVEKPYLKKRSVDEQHPYQGEEQLLKLYGNEIIEKRIHGIKYQSRQIQDDTCYIFYDTLNNLEEYLSAQRV